MVVQLEPLENISLKDACIKKLESLILAGDFKAGERLPSERDLASQLGVSRPVLHQAIVDLDAKGLVKIEPRRGVFISDFRKDGSIPILTTLLSFQDGRYQPELFSSLMAARKLIEMETSRLAADNHRPEDLEVLEKLLDDGRSIADDDTAALVNYDFAIHQHVAIASGNLMYPLMINSLKSVHTNLASMFYKGASDLIITQTKTAHVNLVEAIRDKNAQAAGGIMWALLENGEANIKQFFPQE